MKPRRPVFLAAKGGDHVVEAQGSAAETECTAADARRRDGSVGSRTVPRRRCGAANAIFFNHGQCCCAGSRLFAHKSVYDKVVAGVADIAGRIKVGPGLDPTTEMGPLVSDEQFDRVTSYIEDGRRSGARVTVGGSRVGNLVYFVAPTV